MQIVFFFFVYADLFTLKRTYNGNVTFLTACLQMGGSSVKSNNQVNLSEMFQ